jgi:hypothetical protein
LSEINLYSFSISLALNGEQEQLSGFVTELEFCRQNNTTAEVSFEENSNILQ